jgi:hypothetical protein
VHLLKIEQDLINLVKDVDRQSHKFSPMSSYHRMFVHRVAAFFGLEHNIDEAGSSVIVIKQKGVTRIPEMRFRDQIKNVTHSLDEPKKLILKRDTASFDDFKQPMDRSANNTSNYSEMRKCKSFEEREEQYVKVRARIFNQKNGLENLSPSGPEHCDAGSDQDTSGPSTSDGKESTSPKDIANAKQSISSDESVLPEKPTNTGPTESDKANVGTKDSTEKADKLSSVAGESTKAAYQPTRLKPDETYSNQKTSDFRHSSSNDRYRSNAGHYKKSYSKVNQNYDNHHPSNAAASLLPYPSDVNSSMRAYPPSFPVASYIDYSHPWFSMPALASQEVTPGNSATGVYPQPYFATNPDFYNGAPSKRFLKRVLFDLIVILFQISTKQVIERINAKIKLTCQLLPLIFHIFHRKCNLPAKPTVTSEVPTVCRLKWLRCA